MFYSVERTLMIPKEKGLPVIGFQVTEEEESRLLRIVDRVRLRNASMTLTDVLREIVGLNPLTFVTQEDIAFLQSGKRSPSSSAEHSNHLQRKSAENPNPYEITKRLLAQGYDVDFQTVAEVLIFDTPRVSHQMKELILFEAGILPKQNQQTTDKEASSAEANDL
jgi:hypothetical protein